jgi:hypothetical protein
MTEQQKIHVAMINSFNVITGKATVDDVLDSNVALFSHNFNEELDFDIVMFILKYFSDIDMFEQCAELKKIIHDTFDSNGKYRDKSCECPYPSIKEYKSITECNSCKRKIRR